ncbi:PSD1 and planctomycete cytochrome C domain-containing protein [Pirellula sp. SH-Sr6A]|uniref:PSD1 and planctomycete cytochrome C domain-containing protein n=1 Tax=Pirellula sp. SH-Sr6A TaxID=1632865 RepID=UPI00197C204B|nr:PSD1 and planctomycete cytochrome C domain-containing protein [Pirellula sp. SH-Sr6A]
MRAVPLPLALMVASLLSAPLPLAEAVDYEKDVKALFAERCFACHGVLKQEAGLRLDTAAFMKTGGDSGPAITPGASHSSLVWTRVSSTDPDLRMPPEGEPLKANQIAAIEKWIQSGAPAPEQEEPEQDPEQHWSFQAPVRPMVPTISPPTEETLHPIDAFLAEKQQIAGVQSVSPLDRRLWLRRVSLDLTGLPPSDADQNAFLEDHSPDARGKVIDRLLESPQYGERWGRHWMDIWRYSDWWGLGAEVRNSQKHMWHWRDWIIESLQQDKGYDQMILEMLAADELYPEDVSRLRATGYLARQYFKFNRTTWMDETIEHTFKGMLGLTVNCSKCHDHKYDPITQQNYYELRAIFEPYQVRMDIIGDETDLQNNGIPRAFDCNLDAPTYLHVRGDERNPQTDRPLAPNVPGFLSSTAPFEVRTVQLPVRAVHPGVRDEVAAAYRKQAIRKKENATAAVEGMNKEGETKSPLEREILLLKKSIADQELQSIDLRHTADRLRYLAETMDGSPDQVLAEAARSVTQLAVYRAELACKELDWQTSQESDNKKKEELQKKQETANKQLDEARKKHESPGTDYPSLVGSEKTAESNIESEESRKKPFPKQSTGRRSALARWIASDKNPLTARVAVNHLWARHFGAPLVPTVFDFGRKGSPPTHPELLDWLAVEFMESGWSMKHMHRLMLTSSLYARTSSSKGATEETLRSDRENRLYWRMNPIRMESQVLRDSLLALAEELDMRTGGPSVPVSDAMSKRRSLYYFHSKNEHNQLLSVFDDANVLDCYRRATSIVPQQALALENSQLAQELAIKIAQRIGATSPNSNIPDGDFVVLAFRKLLGYEPNPQEIERSIRFLESLRQAMPVNQDAAPDVASQKSDPLPPQAAFLLALLNHNDFITIR